MTESSRQIMARVRAAESKGDSALADRLYDLYWQAVDREREIARKLNEYDWAYMAKQAEINRKKRR